MGKKPSRKLPKVNAKKGNVGKKPVTKKKASRQTRITKKQFRRILNRQITGKELIEIVRAKKMPVDKAAFIFMMVPGKASALNLSRLLKKVLNKKMSVNDIIKKADHKQISAEGAAFLLEQVPGRKIRVDLELMEKVTIGEVDLARLVRGGEKGKLQREVALFLMGQIPFDKTERFVVGRRIKYNEFMGNPFKRRAYEVTRRVIYHKTLNKLIDDYTNRVTKAPKDKDASHVLRFLADPVRKLKLPFDLYFFEMKEAKAKGKFLKHPEKRALFREKLPGKITPLGAEFGRTYAKALKEGFEAMRKVKRRRKILKDIQTKKETQQGYVKAMAARWQGRVIGQKQALRIGQISLEFVLKRGNFPSEKDLMRNPEVKVYLEKKQKAASDETRIYTPKETEELRKAIEEAKKKKGKQ